MKLKELRELNNITQIQMAEYLGVRVSTYNQYENNKRNIPITIVNKICCKLCVSKEDIFLPVKFTVSK